MPIIKCPIVGCPYVTEDVDPALITVHATSHTTPAMAHVEKPRRTVLQMKSGGCSEEDWTFFQNQFCHYKNLSNLTENEPRHLRECLDVELQQLLYATLGTTINTISESQMLQQVERLAVRTRNKLVATQKLRGKKQGEDQTVQTYVADLRSTAMECDLFHVTYATCKVNVSYADKGPTYCWIGRRRNPTAHPGKRRHIPK